MSTYIVGTSEYNLLCMKAHLLHFDISLNVVCRVSV